MALVGCGAISSWHRRAIEILPDIEITAVVDTDPLRARKAGVELRVPAFPSLEAALAWGDFDAVDVMVPHRLHEQLALQVLGARKHLLLEKPIAPTLAAAHRVLQAAKSAGVVFMVGETTQYWHEVCEVQRLIQSGAIGDLMTVQAQAYYAPAPEFFCAGENWRMSVESTGGGIGMDSGPHYVRCLRMICGELDEVFACHDRPYARMEGESLVRALFITAERHIASMDLCLTDAPLAPRDMLRVNGMRGEIVVNSAGVWLHDSPGEAPRRTTAPRADGYFAAFRDELADFASAVIRGTPLAASAAEAFGDLAVIEAMTRSAQSRRSEKICGSLTREYR